MDLFERMERPTPKLFRRLRNIGLGLTAIGGSVITVPIMLPLVLTKIAGYLIVAGTVASVVSQTVINDSDEDDDYNDPTDLMGGAIAFDSNPLLDPNR